jgi:hypothetical protein
MIGMNERLDFRMNNEELLNGQTHSGSMTVGDLTSAIGINRPLTDQNEAILSAQSVRNVLAFVESALITPDGQLNPWEDVQAGLAEIIRACRLVTLRVEQFMYDQENKGPHIKAGSA